MDNRSLNDSQRSPKSPYSGLAPNAHKIAKDPTPHNVGPKGFHSETIACTVPSIASRQTIVSTPRLLLGGSGALVKRYGSRNADVRNCIPTTTGPNRRMFGFGYRYSSRLCVLWRLPNCIHRYSGNKNE